MARSKDGNEQTIGDNMKLNTSHVKRRNIVVVYVLHGYALKIVVACAKFYIRKPNAPYEM